MKNKDLNNKTQSAIERIKELECPTGEIEGRIARILESYEVASSRDVEIENISESDINDGQVYKVQIANENQSIVVEAKSGMDDYVTIVIDAYME